MSNKIVIKGIDIHNEYHKFTPTKRQLEIIIKVWKGEVLFRLSSTHVHTECFLLAGIKINATPVYRLMEFGVFGDKYVCGNVQMVLGKWVIECLEKSDTKLA